MKWNLLGGPGILLCLFKFLSQFLGELHVQREIVVR